MPETREILIASFLTSTTARAPQPQIVKVSDGNERHMWTRILMGAGLTALLGACSYDTTSASWTTRENCLERYERALMTNPAADLPLREDACPTFIAAEDTSAFQRLQLLSDTRRSGGSESNAAGAGGGSNGTGGGGSAGAGSNGGSGGGGSANDGSDGGGPI